jgi:hypothetical protein
LNEAELRKILTFRPTRRGKEWLGDAPPMVFVGDMTDLFHPDIPFAMLDSVWATMALRPDVVFQVLTKRPERMRAYFERDTDGFMRAESRIEHRAKRLSRDRGTPIPNGKTLLGTMPLPHVWLGTSIEDQATADARIPHLLATPAAADSCGFGVPPAVETSVSLAPADAPDWAVVTIRNRLAGRSGHPDIPCILAFDGEEVAVFYNPGPRTRPDLFRVVAPPGYVADPAELMVDDETSATVVIRPRANMPMG